MTTSDAPHWDVAAYALGVLDRHDAARFEDHLAECASCAMELESLLPVTALLAEVDASSFVGVEQSQREGRMLDEMVNVVTFDRSRQQARRLLAVAAGTIVMVMAVGLALFAGSQWGASADTTAQPRTSSSSPTVGVGGPDGGSSGQSYSATDPTTGTKADVVLQGYEWGTNITLQLAGVYGPINCQLVAVGSDSSEIISTWKVPTKGYGTDKHKDPLLVPASTAMSRSDIKHLEVQQVENGAPTKVLVSIPV